MNVRRHLIVKSISAKTNAMRISVSHASWPSISNAFVESRRLTYLVEVSNRLVEVSVELLSTAVSTPVKGDVTREFALLVQRTLKEWSTVLAVIAPSSLLLEDKEDPALIQFLFANTSVRDSFPAASINVNWPVTQTLPAKFARSKFNSHVNVARTSDMFHATKSTTQPISDRNWRSRSWKTKKNTLCAPRFATRRKLAKDTSAKEFAVMLKKASQILRGTISAFKFAISNLIVANTCAMTFAILDSVSHVEFTLKILSGAHVVL